jgi:predicted nucleotidyltransferase
MHRSRPTAGEGSDQEVVGQRGGMGPPRRESPVPTRAADPEVVNAIVIRLVHELKPQQIYLFGSRARGDATEDSDYDLLVVVDERVGAPFEMEQRSRRALRDIRQPMDVVIYTRRDFEWMLEATASLPATVKREGRLLYVR